MSPSHSSHEIPTHPSHSSPHPPYPLTASHTPTAMQTPLHRIPLVIYVQPRAVHVTNSQRLHPITTKHSTEPPATPEPIGKVATHEIFKSPGAEIDCSQQQSHPSAASVTLVHVGFMSLQMRALRNLRCRQGSCSVGVGRGGRGVVVDVAVVVTMVVVSWARASGRAARRRTGRGMCILEGLVVMMMGGRGVELKGNSDGSFS